MDSTQEEEILQIQARCDQFQRNCKYQECIDDLEQLLERKQDLYGLGSAEYAETTERLCEVLNLQSMIHLQKEKFQVAIECLKRAEQLGSTSLKIKATTFNNLACFYRRTGKLRTAYNYLQMAFDLELKIGSCSALADTHLNLCAVLSQLDRHQQALEHSLLSIVLLQDEFLQPALKSTSNSQNLKIANPDRLAVLAIAFHNLGVELEHLKRYDESIQIYQRALSFAQDNLGQHHSLVSNLSKVLNSAALQLDGSKGKNRMNSGFQRKIPRESIKEKTERTEKQSERLLKQSLGSYSNQTVLSEQDRNRNLPKLQKCEYATESIQNTYSYQTEDSKRQGLPRSLTGQERQIKSEQRASSVIPRRKPPQHGNANSLSRADKTTKPTTMTPTSSSSINNHFDFPTRNNQYSIQKSASNHISSQSQRGLDVSYNSQIRLGSPNTNIFSDQTLSTGGIALNNYSIPKQQIKEGIKLDSQQVGFPQSCSSQSSNAIGAQIYNQQAAQMQKLSQYQKQQQENRDQPSFPIDGTTELHKRNSIHLQKN